MPPAPRTSGPSGWCWRRPRKRGRAPSTSGSETLLFPDIDLPMRWLALQTVATTPGLSAERLAALLVKAAREADRRTSWVEPDEDYEQRLAALAHDVLVWPPVAELAAPLTGRVGRPRWRCWQAGDGAGVPDVYQGTEGFRFVLVDPDNRRPPDLGELRRAGAPGQHSRRHGGVERAAQRVGEGGRLHWLLALRRRLPDVFGPAAATFRWRPTKGRSSRSCAPMGRVRREWSR